jgi:hypothetical protein
MQFGQYKTWINLVTYSRNIEKFCTFSQEVHTRFSEHTVYNGNWHLLVRQMVTKYGEGSSDSIFMSASIFGFIRKPLKAEINLTNYMNRIFCHTKHCLFVTRMSPLMLFTEMAAGKY